MSGWQTETDRQIDRPIQNRPKLAQHRPQTDPKPTPHRLIIDPKSRKLTRRTRKRSKKRKQSIPSMLALVFLRFGPIWRRSWAPLDFYLGPKIVQKGRRRDFFGFLRSPRSIFVHFQVNIISKITFDRCKDTKTTKLYFVEDQIKQNIRGIRVYVAF